MTHQRHHILILGGGFGGLYAALQLEKTLATGIGRDAWAAQNPEPVLFQTCR